MVYSLCRLNEQERKEYMAKYLVIVESPAKAKTIKKFLGSNYEVIASNGHVRDLPKSQMGIDVDNDFEPKYITIRGKGDILAQLRKEVKKADKVYLATDPDREGEAISYHLSKALKLDEEQVRQVILGFKGDYDQIPPMYSALKVDGKKLCDLARAGKEVERKARRVQILDISVEKIELPRVWMRVSCSKGTYIRTLCEDIGAKLQVGGCMESLLRTRVDRFLVKDSLKLDQIEALRDEGKVGEHICSLEEALESYLPVYTTADGDKALKNGNPCFKQQLDLEKSTSLESQESGNRYRMYSSQGIFMGVYEYQEEKHWWKPWKMFMPDGEGNQ